MSASFITSERRAAATRRRPTVLKQVMKPMTYNYVPTSPVLSMPPVTTMIVTPEQIQKIMPQQQQIQVQPQVIPQVQTSDTLLSTEDEIIIMREKQGRCPKCGIQTFNVGPLIIMNGNASDAHEIKSTGGNSPLTNAYVLGGRCLLCRPMEEKMMIKHQEDMVHKSVEERQSSRQEDMVHKSMYERQSPFQRKKTEEILDDSDSEEEYEDEDNTRNDLSRPLYTQTSVLRAPSYGNGRVTIDPNPTYHHIEDEESDENSERTPSPSRSNNNTRRPHPENSTKNLRRSSSRSVSPSRVRKDCLPEADDEIRDESPRHVSSPSTTDIDANRTQMEIACINSGDITSLLRTMNQNPSNAPLQEIACARLRILARDLEHIGTIIETGGLAAIISAMTKHASNAEIQSNGSGAIANIALKGNQRAKRSIVFDLLGAECVIKGMAQHPQHSAVQMTGCSALGNLALPSKEEPEEQNAGGMFGGIYSSLFGNGTENNWDVDDVSSYCGSDFSQHCGLEDDSAMGSAYAETVGTTKVEYLGGEAIAVMEAGGVRSIMRAMKLHPRDCLVVEQACGSLMSLTSTNLLRVVDTIAVEGGIDALISAMKCNPSAAGVQSEAAGAIANLAMVTKLEIDIGRNNGIAFILKAMKSHPLNMLVQRNGCGALRNLSHSKENVAMIDHLQPRNVLKQAMDSFPDECNELGGLVIRKLDLLDGTTFSWF